MDDSTYAQEADKIIERLRQDPPTPMTEIEKYMSMIVYELTKVDHTK